MQHDYLTHHCVDDLPQIDELPAWDQAMDKFRQMFPVPSFNVYVHPNGKTMRYRMRGSQCVEQHLRAARLTILLHKLPLTAERSRFEVKGVVFEDNLIIQYVGK